MDLRLFWGVVRRYRRLATAGTLLAAVLAILAYGTPTLSHGKPTLVPHSAPTYEAKAQLLITLAGSLYGQADAKTFQLAEASYMSSLSPIYAGIANGDAVQSALRATRIPGTVSASEGVDPNTGNYTPFVTLVADGPSPSDVALLIRRAIASFQGYVGSMEVNAGVPASSRVVLEVVDNGLPPRLASGRKLTIPLLVFVAALTGLIALLFSLENKDPRTAVVLGRVDSFDRAAARASSTLTGSHDGESHRTEHRNGVGEPPRERTSLTDRLMRH